MKRLVALLLAVIMAVSLCVPAFAASVTDSDRDEVLFAPGVEPRGPKYHYKTVYQEPEIFTRTHYVKKPTTGIGAKKGEYITYISDDSESETFSLSCTLPPPFNMLTVGISVPFGAALKGNNYSGKAMPVYEDGLYRIAVEKTFSVRAYVTYEARVGTEDWQYYSSGAHIYDDNIIEYAYLVRVGDLP